MPALNFCTLTTHSDNCFGDQRGPTDCTGEGADGSFLKSWYCLAQVLLLPHPLLGPPCPLWTTWLSLPSQFGSFPPAYSWTPCPSRVPSLCACAGLLAPSPGHGAHSGAHSVFLKWMAVHWTQKDPGGTLDQCSSKCGPGPPRHFRFKTHGGKWMLLYCDLGKDTALAPWNLRDDLQRHVASFVYMPGMYAVLLVSICLV